MGEGAAAGVEGAIDAAGQVGVKTEDAVREAAVGAVDAADAVGTEVGAAVRRALLSAASLPRDLIEAAIGGSKEEGGEEEQPSA